MPDKKIEILINAKDEASQVLGRIGGNLSELKKNAEALAKPLVAIGVISAGVAKTSIDAATQMQNSLIGLNTVATAFGSDAKQAEQAAKDLASDGLMSVSDAASGLKNLLATGFSLPEAIKLMNAFRDSAAFNRQGSLEFGQAIVGATEGLKNQNSIMVDNAGVTKNLSVILKEAGFSQQDLMNVTTDASVRQALYNGILKETSAFQGDAGRASDGLQGNMARLNTSVFNLRAQIGEALAPALIQLIEAITPLLEKFTAFAEQNPQLVTAIIGITLALGALGTIILALSPIIAALTAAFAIIVSPIGLVVVAIVALIAIGVLLMKHWDQVQQKAVQVWEFIKKLVQTVFAFMFGNITEKMKAIADIISVQLSIVDKIFGTSLSSAWNKVKNFGENVLGVFNKISDTIGGLIGKLKELASVAGGVVGGVKGALGFQHGGVVPGSFNQAVPAVLHGGERVVSRNGTDVNSSGSDSGRSGMVNIIIEGDVNSMDTLNKIVEAVKSSIGRDNELVRLGVAI